MPEGITRHTGDKLEEEAGKLQTPRVDGKKSQ
jgi:hypothetical protein